MEEVQEVDTSGATDWEAFTVDGATYLAVANSYDDITHHKVKSRIYRHSAMSDRFELVQEVDTIGARDWEAFTSNGTTYLAVANYFDGSTRNLKSHIYRHSAASGRFELMQELDTSGAYDWEAFTADGATYLAVANYYNGTHNLESRIYRHSAMSDRFELTQDVNTSGATDWEAFTLHGVAYLAVANHRDGSNFNLNSRIYRHSTTSGQFELVQEVGTSGVFDWKAFTLDGDTYLAVAAYNIGGAYNIKSRIYRHSAISGQFELLQEVDTSGARDWQAFTLAGGTYLAVANHYDGNINNLKSRIYRHSVISGQFELVQEVDTTGAADWEAFTLNGITYLAVADNQDGSTYNVKSRIVRLTVPC